MVICHLQLRERMKEREGQKFKINGSLSSAIEREREIEREERERERIKIICSLSSAIEVLEHLHYDFMPSSLPYIFYL